jgi:carbamate kinase
MSIQRIVVALGGKALIRRGDGADVATQRANVVRAVRAVAALAGVLGAESDGMIGYPLEQELVNVLPGASVATLLTQASVDAADPAFARPTKPIGPVFDEPAGRRMAAERGSVLAGDGDGVRRVVASPEPQAILELATIRLIEPAIAAVTP